MPKTRGTILGVAIIRIAGVCIFRESPYGFRLKLVFSLVVNQLKVAQPSSQRGAPPGFVTARFSGLGHSWSCKISGLEFRIGVWGLGFEVWSFVFEVQGCLEFRILS